MHGEQSTTNTVVVNAVDTGAAPYYDLHEISHFFIMGLNCAKRK